VKVQQHRGSIFIVEDCTPLECIVLSVIHSLDYGEEFVHIKQTLLAEMCGVDVSSMVRVLKILEDKDLLVVTKYKMRNQVKGYKVNLND
jgi:CRP-like cAMP-binding protein